MIFLPIVARELRVAARRRGTYWLRSAVALLATIIGVFFNAAAVRVPPQSVGEYTFLGLSVLALVYCLVAGRRFTADCLSGEKREGTLGLLFLTDLKGYDVVGGKLAATALPGLYGLLAIFPVLAIPLLLGGITQGEFWRMVLVLLNTFLLSLAIGVFASALTRDARHAFAANFIVLLAVTGVGPALEGAVLAASSFSPPRPIPGLLYSCPIYPFYLCADARYKLQPGDFWGAMATLQALTWLLILLASWMVPRSWQDRAAVAVKIRWRDRWRTWNYGNTAQRKTFRAQLLDINAFYWLASRARRKPDLVWAFLVGMAFWVLWVWFDTGGRMYSETLITAAVILNLTLKLWIAIESAQRLAEDQTLGALELLLSTRMTVRDLIQGQLLALRRQFLKPMLLVLAVELLFMAASVRAEPPGSHRLLLAWSAGMLLLLADAAALIWVAMSAALTARNLNQAILSALWRILALPWVAYGVIAVLANLRASVLRLNDPTWKFYLALWFGLGLLADLGFGLLAWSRLRKRFRETAQQRFSSKPARPALAVAPPPPAPLRELSG